MKFDTKYPYGSRSPGELRSALLHLDKHTFQCVKCGDPTSWVLRGPMTATCSEECLLAQVVQKGCDASPKHNPGNIGTLLGEIP